MVDKSHEFLFGEIKATLANLDRQLAVDREAAAAHRAESKESRTRIYAALDEIRAKASHTDHTADDMRRDLEDLLAWKRETIPKLALMERWKERGIGAWMLVVFVSTAMGGIIIAAWKWLAVRLGLG